MKTTILIAVFGVVGFFAVQAYQINQGQKEAAAVHATEHAAEVHAAEEREAAADMDRLAARIQLQARIASEQADMKRAACRARRDAASDLITAQVHADIKVSTETLREYHASCR
jgi:hypothetical protein